MCLVSELSRTTEKELTGTRPVLPKALERLGPEFPEQQKETCRETPSRGSLKCVGTWGAGTQERTSLPRGHPMDPGRTSECGGRAVGGLIPQLTGCGTSTLLKIGEEHPSERGCED